IVYKHRPEDVAARSSSDDKVRPEDALKLINHGDKYADASQELPQPIDVTELREQILVAFPQAPLVLRGSFFYNCDITGKLDRRTRIFPVLVDLFGDWARERILAAGAAEERTSEERQRNSRAASRASSRGKK
ncbi:unnamed protein product, partial [Amoebophrya sp. A25]